MWSEKKSTPKHKSDNLSRRSYDTVICKDREVKDYERVLLWEVAILLQMLFLFINYQ